MCRPPLLRSGLPPLRVSFFYHPSDIIVRRQNRRVRAMLVAGVVQIARRPLSADLDLPGRQLAASSRCAFWHRVSLLYHTPDGPHAVIRLVDERGLLRPKPPPADPAPISGREFFDLQFGFHSSPLRTAPLPEPRAAPLRLVIIFLSWLIPAQSPFRSSSAPLADDTSRHGCLSPATQVFHVVTYAHLRISSSGDRIAGSGQCSSHE